MARAHSFWGLALITAASLLAGTAHASAPGHSRASSLQAVDALLAIKCAAFTKSECRSSTRSRGTKALPLFENVGGKPDALKVPPDARRDATAGVFI